MSLSYAYYMPGLQFNARSAFSRKQSKSHTHRIVSYPSDESLRLGDPFHEVPESYALYQAVNSKFYRLKAHFFSGFCVATVYSVLVNRWEQPARAGSAGDIMARDWSMPRTTSFVKEIARNCEN